MSAKFLLDENLSPAAAVALVKDGIDAYHVRDRGILGATDHDLLERAYQEDRILITSNVLDFEKLATLFATQQGHRLNLAPDAAESLLLWSWPYNVRELENLIHRWCAMATSGAQLTSSELHRLCPAMAASADRGQTAPQPGPAPVPTALNPSGLVAARDPLRDRDALDSLLRDCDGNVSEAARRLGTTRAQVYRWMARLGLSSPRSPGQAS